MNIDKNSSAEYLKCLIIDFFIHQKSNIIIGNELMYGSKRKVVDLVVIDEKHLIGIEIKGENDDLRRLEEQLQECKKIFDYVILFTTEGHHEKLKKIISEDIGLYIITDNAVKKVRSGKKQKYQDKLEMLYTMNSKYLKSIFDDMNSRMNSDEIRYHVSKKSINIIKLILHKYLTQKLETKYKLFLLDRGLETHIDDIPILSSHIEIQ